VRIVKALLDKVDDKNKLDMQGWMALDLALFYRHDLVVQLLDPEGKVKVFPWQVPKESRYRIVDGQRRRYSWNLDREKAEGRAEAP
jgi:ankyrin repeat protein